MGRKSKLTEKQWAEVGERLLNGESIRGLGREFGVAYSTIRERFSDQHQKIKAVADQLVSVDAALKQLPISAQISAHNLASRLKSISEHLAGAAEYGAMTAHKLSGIAKFKADEIDDADPLGEKSIETLRGIAALTKTANEAGMIGLTLIRASKDNPEAFNPSETDSRPSPARVREILDMARPTHDRA